PVGVMLQALDYLHAADFGTSENAVGWFLPDMTVAMSLRELSVGEDGGKGRRGDGETGTGRRGEASTPQHLNTSTLNTQDSDMARLFAELPRRVHDNLARLYRLQLPAGGWSWGEG